MKSGWEQFGRIAFGLILMTIALLPSIAVSRIWGAPIGPPPEHLFFATVIVVVIGIWSLVLGTWGFCLVAGAIEDSLKNA